MQSQIRTFRERVREALRRVELKPGNRATQSELAGAIGISSKELSLRLNGSGGKRLTPANVQAIVLQLANWGALSTTAQVDELLELAACPGFSAEQLAAPPLAQLAATPPEATAEQAAPIEADPTLANLVQFRELVREARRRADPYHNGSPPSQDDLASAIGLSPKELSARLNGSSGRRLTARDGRAIVRTLADWGAITSRAEAQDLLSLLALPSFSAAEWASPPLNLLIAAPPAAATPNNLPRQLTSFVGREREVADCQRLLAAHSLLTLVGAGGMGKTRLSLELAAQLLPDFPDGVYFVALAELSDPSLVSQAAARAIGLHESRAQTSADLLRDYLRKRRVLLVLDNCEHLTAAAATLARMLLTSCPHLTILATSREKLGVSGEVVYDLGSLRLPPPREHTLAVLAQSEAVALFVARASAVQPSFNLSPTVAIAVNEICHLLDGIPLAIELAAPLVRVLAPAQMAQRLHAQLPLLVSADASLPSRQRTMRASIAWSYDLLTDAEQTLFARLSVFRGGWQLEAAETICAGEGLSEADVLAVLIQLVDKSLVAARDIGGEMRYQMLEAVREYALNKLNAAEQERRYEMRPVIREYASEKLAESANAAQVHQRHVLYYLALSERGAAEMDGGQQVLWLDHLEREHGNFEAALDYALAAGDDDAALKLAVNLSQFWLVRGYYSEGDRFLTAALAHEGPPSSLRANALRVAGALAKERGDVVSARTRFENSLSMARQLDDLAVIAATLSVMGLLAREQSEYPQAEALLSEALAIRQQLNDQRGIAAAFSSLGLIADEQGNYAAAQQLTEAGLAALRQLGDKVSSARVLRSLADIALRQGNYDAAWAALEESRSLSHELGSKLGIASSLAMQGIVAGRRGEYVSARRLLEEALTPMLEVGHKMGVAQILNQLADVTFYQGDLAKANQLYAESLRLAEELDYKVGLISTLEGIAATAVALGENEQAAHLYGAAENLRSMFDLQLEGYDQQAQERAITSLIAAMGAEYFTRTLAVGRRMSRTEAVAYALTQVQHR